MTVAKSHNAYEQGEGPTWAWPVYAFVAWLATILGYMTRFKSARRFKPDWRDSWEDLRQSEWLRDQLIAQGVSQLLNNKPLHLDDTKIQLTPSASYGGPCPRTPFDMNRRFIAIARWAADPEAIIRERFRQLSRSPFAAHASTDALRAAQHEPVRASRSLVALMLSSDRRERPSKHARGLACARGPPLFPILPNSAPVQLESARFRERIIMPGPVGCIELSEMHHRAATTKGGFRYALSTLRSPPHAPARLRPLSRPSTTACRGRGGPARSRTTE